MKLTSLCLAVAFTAALHALMANTTPAQTLTTEERLARIEAQLSRLEQRLGDTISADELAPTLKEYSALTKNLDWNGKSSFIAVKGAGKEKSLTLGGYIHAQAEAGDAPDDRYGTASPTADRIYIRRARITVKGSFAEHLDFALQTDLSANTLGSTSSARAQMTDALVTYKKFPLANFTVGQFKTPYGYEQLLSDAKGPFIERSLPNDRLTISRQQGIAISGAAPSQTFTYSLGAFNGNGINTSVNDNDQFMYVGRIAGQIWAKDKDRLTLGANAFRSRDSVDDHRTGSGVDLQFSTPRFEAAAEFLQLDSDKLTGADTKSDGWSAWFTYHLIPNKLQSVLRYETYDSNTDTTDTTSETWVLGLNYFLKGDDLKLSFNYAYGNPAGTLDWQGRFLSRLQVVF